MNAPLSAGTALRGTDKPVAEAEALKCGPLALEFVDGDVRGLTAAGTELVRRIYVTVRDKDWNTITPELSVRKRVVRDDSVLLQLAARHRSQDLDLSWQGSVELGADGSLTYDLNGRAETSFDYCRIGFCLLFAAEGAGGRSYRAWTSEGVVSGSLPVLIAPQRVVDGFEVPLVPPCGAFELDLPNGTVRVEIEGDLFEMEDQRNWTDASFKMYCTPLALGYPFTAHAGQAFHQRVRVTTAIRGAGGESDVGETTTIDVAAAAQVSRPAIGIGASSALGRPMNAAEATLISALRPDHLRVDLHLEADGWADVLTWAVGDAEALGCPLELAVHVDADNAVETTTQLAARLGSIAPARVLVLDAGNHGKATTPPTLVAAVRRVLRAAGVTAPIGGGTDGGFAEVNRDRPDCSGMDFVAYALNPQVHMYDDAYVLQNIPTQAITVATSRSFCGDVPIVVSPVTLRPRFNLDAERLEDMDPAPAPGELPASVDPRQMSLFAAAWGLGSMASLIRSGAQSLTFFETVGWRGVAERTTDDLPDGPFQSTPGMVFPLYHLWRDLTEGVSDTGCIPVLDSIAGLAALAMSVVGGRRVVLANLWNKSRRVCVTGLSGGQIKERILDAASATKAAYEPAEFRNQWQSVTPTDGRVTIELRPYAYVRLDEEDGWLKAGRDSERELP